MELKQIDTIRREHETIKRERETIEIYEIGRYTVTVFTYESGYRSISVRGDGTEYLPEIYSRDDYEGNVLGFDVQTTSYGALCVDEIRKVVAGLEEATQVAKILSAEFVK